MAKLISADLTNNNLCILEYSTTDGIMLSINTHSFDANIEAHTYTDIGRIIFGTPVTTIGVAAFEGCSNLTSVIIPDSVTMIRTDAFRDCSSLTSVTIPDSVTTIEEYAFYGCSGLTSVVIPGSVTEIGKFAFYGCSGLTSIKVADGNKIYDSRNNCNAIIETATNTLVCGCEATIIPDSVTKIGDFAFEGCRGLTSVVIPEGVTEIGDFACSNCSGLTSVYCKPITPPLAAGYSMFSDNASGRKIYVLASSIEAYKAASYWSRYKSDIEGYDF